MGVSVAVEAARRGARVHLVLGPGTVAPPPGLETEHVTSAEQMRAAIHAHLDVADAVVMAAAVADFRPKRVSPGKLKKDDGHPELILEPTASATRSAQTRIGAGRNRGGTTTRGAASRAKLMARCHLRWRTKGAPGQVGRTNHAAIFDATGDDVLADWTKAELATAIVDRIVARLD
jgi:phosphopantothenoylcysteine decarboxylase/phosphopantothenate--cysteine ligase